MDFSARTGGTTADWCIGTLLVRTKESLHQCSEGQQRVDGDTRARLVPRSRRRGGAGAGVQVGRRAWHGPMVPGGEEGDDVVDAAGHMQADERERLPRQRMGRVKDGDLTRRRIYR